MSLMCPNMEIGLKTSRKMSTTKNSLNAVETNISTCLFVGEKRGTIRTVELVKGERGDRLHLRTRLDYKWPIRTNFEINL